MKNKLFTAYSKKLISIVLSLIVFLGIPAQGKTLTVDEMENLINGIVTWKMAQTNSDTVQDLIDNGLVSHAGTGTTEWFIIALRQYKTGYRYTAYTAALDEYIKGIKNQKATDLQRIAIAYSATGSNTDYIHSTISSSIGKLGVMSYIYGLLLLDSGAYTSTAFNRNDIIINILSLRQSDGGWALTGGASDNDITAMAIQALAPYYEDSDVKNAVDKALALLSKRQLDSGDYSSWGTRNAESTAQVIAALSALGRDCRTDSQFIKKGKTLIDGLMNYRLPDGSFSHTLGGASNNTASVQAMVSLVSAWRQSKGLGSFYQFTVQSVPRVIHTTTGSGGRTEPEVTTGTQSTGTGNQSTSVTQTTVTESAKSTSVSDVSNATTKTESLQNTSHTAKSSAPSQAAKPLYRYKGWAYGGICLLALLLITLLFIKKKNHIKNILLIAALTAVALLSVFFSKIQSVDEYYLVHIDDIQPDSKTVSISIRCDTVLGKQTADYIPADGSILKKTEYVLRDSDTVFDLLIRAAKHNKIPVEYDGGNLTATAYIKGIQNLYEYDFGPTSGWLYKVNGELEGVGCSDYVLSDGDVIEWVYSLNLGKDVGGK